MLRKEVGYLYEIIFWEILYSTNCNIWMDSSLRHAAFFEAMFKNIHLRFPFHRIALLNIKCETKIVFERAMKRAKITGRHVPESDIQQSIDEVPHSVDTLSDLADVVAHIDNSFDAATHQTPKLLQIICNDTRNNSTKPAVVDDPTWSTFKDVWNGNSLFTTTNSKL